MGSRDKECKIQFRSYSDDDVIQIIELLKPNWTYLQSSEALQYWKWLYTSYHGGKAFVVVADHDGKIVGHYAMFPMKMRYDSLTVRGGKAEGSAVHKEYRGNIANRFCPQVADFRIFDNLIKLLWKNAAEDSISLIWGFPNTAAIKPQIRAGYSHHIIDLHSLVLPFDTKGTIDLNYSDLPLKGRIRSTFILLARIYCKLRTRRHASNPAMSEERIVFRRLSQEDLTDRFDRFLGAYHEENSQITVERDSDYVKWRFLENPVIPHRMYVSERNGEFTAIITTNISEKNGIRAVNIVDIIGLEKRSEDLRGLLGHIVRDMRNERVACIRVWISKCKQSKIYANALKKNGFINLPTGIQRPKIFLIYRIIDSCLDKTFAENPRNWYISMAFTEGTS